MGYGDVWYACVRSGIVQYVGVRYIGVGCMVVWGMVT